MYRCLFTAAFSTLIALIPVISFAQDYNYPADAGLVDVTKAPYFADSTGTTDATSAIQAALDAYPSGNRIIYLPNGTYLVSNTLKWPEGTSSGNYSKRTILQGQSREGAIIKLKDHCTGYQDPDNRKGVLFTGTAPAQRFRNSIYRLTVNTGAGNPGACGIQFNCSNEGTIQEVKIISEDRQGVFGLDLAFTNEIGPGYIYDLIVEGFNIGVMHGNFINSMTFEKITVRNQLETGFKNGANVCSIRGLTSENSVTAVWNKGGAACMVLLDAELTGGSPDVPAIMNGGTLYGRNIHCEGYARSLESTSGLALNKNRMEIDEYSSHEVIRLFPSHVNMLNLEVKDLPLLPWSDPSEWANPMSYGAVGDGEANDTKAIQDAIDAGKETVYFPGGLRFAIDDTLFIRGEVKRITGCEGKLTGNGTIVFTEGIPDTVILERIDCIYNNLELVHNSSRTLYYHSSTGMQVESYGSGDFFMCNIVNGTLRFYNPEQKIWIRHLNTEEHDTINVGNYGATLWVLGHKTERGNIKIFTDNGGKTELLGAHNYSTSSEKVDPWFVVKDASLSVACARETNYGGYPYVDYIQEIRGDQSAVLTRLEAPKGGAGGGRVIPMYSGKEIDSELPGTPRGLSFDPSGTNYDLSWTASKAPDFDYYSLYFSLSEGGSYTMLTNYLTDTTYTYIPEFPDTIFFVVTAVNTLGVESDYSAGTEIVVPDYGAPAVPSNLSGSRLNENSVQLEWEANTEKFFNHYNIYRSTTGGVIYVPLAERVTETSFIDTTVSNAYTFDYVISAVSIFGEESDQTGTVTIYPVGVEEKNRAVASDFILYPNPARDRLYVEDSVQENYHIRIFSLDGKLCFDKSHNATATCIDVSQFDKGVYMVHAGSRDRMIVKKIVIY